MKIPVENPPFWTGNERIAAAWEEGGYTRFAVVGRTDIISAQVVDGKLILFPDRSAQHKALYVALGLNEA